jgi:hypothetical protein
MYFYSNVFAELAAKVRGGDFEAQEQLRLELEGALTVMVRQTLNGGRNTSSIGRRILSVARRLTEEGVLDAENLEREVVQNVCDEVVARLQPSADGVPAGDSVRYAAQTPTLMMC